MIRVTLAQAAHFILNKNFLGADKAGSLVELVKQLAGLPAEPGSTPFLAAQARLTHFTPADLLAELSPRRTLLKSQLMRGDAYLVPTEDFVTRHAATARQRNQVFNSQFRLWGLDNHDVETLEEAILTASIEWPASLETITGLLPPSLVRQVSQTSRGGRVTTASNVALVLAWLAAKGVLYADEATKNPTDLDLSGSSETTLYALLSHAYPSLNLAEAPGEAEAQTALAWAYLAAFGPATEADLSFWSGFGKSETARATGNLAAETTLVLVEGLPGMLLLLKTQADALAATVPPAQPVINLLPADDPYPTAHRASRSRYLTDPTLQRHVFSSSGAAQPALVVNGQIVGLWDTQLEQNRLTWQLLSPVDPTLLPLLRAEIERTAAFIRPGLNIESEIT